MNFNPILNASLAVQLHLIAVACAILLIIAIWRVRKGSGVHKRLGRIWVGAMGLTAISSFWINDLDQFMGFSWIHLLSIYVLYSCYAGVRSARLGNVAAHKRTMKSMAFGGLGIAGAFTFMPGRLMYNVFLAPWF